MGAAAGPATYPAAHRSGRSPARRRSPATRQDRRRRRSRCLRRRTRSGLGGLTFGPLVAVDAQLGVVGEIGAELQEERAEVVIDAVKVELIDQTGRLHDPRVGITVAVTSLFGAK